MKFKKLLQIKKYAFSTILSLLAVCSFTQLIAQPPPPTMDLKIEFDETTDIYGVYFRSDLEINSASMIISQVSLALPQMLNLGDLTITSSSNPASSTWVIFNNVQEPAADSVYDYVSIKNTGGLITALAGDWQQFFEFTLTGGCQKGVRLFNNLSDPQASDPGMNNISFVNSINIIDNGTFLSPYRENKAGLTQIVFVDEFAIGTNSGDTWLDANPSLANAINNADCWKTEIWVAEGMYKPTIGVNRNSSFNLNGATSIYGGFVGSEMDRSQRLGSHENTILSGDIGTLDTAYDNSYNVVRVNNRGLMSMTIDGFRIIDGQANHVSNNGRKRGGGIYINKSNVIIRNCQTEYNYCTSNGAGVYAYRSIVTIEELESINNFAGNHGGGLFSNRTELTLTSSNMSNNTALNRGGGVYFNNGNASMTNVTLNENDALRGGGAYCSNVQGSIIQSLLTNNSAMNEGSGLFLHKANTLAVISCTLADNLLGAGQAALKITGNSDVILANSILWNEEGEEIESATTAVSVSFSNVEGGYSPGTNVTNLDPEFIDTENYRLEDNSPLLDLGLSVLLPLSLTTDLDENPRVIGLDVDMGVYENQNGGSQPKLAQAESSAIINVYPNPVIDELTISCDALRYSQCIIINNYGQQILQREINSGETTLNFQSLPSATYHIILLGEFEKECRTIIKL